jgi:hypothetical protein
MEGPKFKKTNELPKKAKRIDPIIYLLTFLFTYWLLVLITFLGFLFTIDLINHLFV